MAAAAATAAAAPSARGETEATSTSVPGSSATALGGAATQVVPGDPSTISASIIDMDIFGQLLEMDDEDEQFSKEIVWNYFEQAESTFEKMDKAFSDKDLPELSQLGHFLKGSSAAVGVIKVRDSCEYMQHYGKKADKDGITVLTEEDALSKLTTTLKDVKIQYKEAEEILRRFYDDSGDNKA